MAVRDDRSDVKQTTAGFRDPRHLIYQKQIPIPALSVLWQKPWKILVDFPMPVAVGDDNFASCSDWLRLYDEIYRNNYADF
mgnify:CR=1 FL=1|jgi:hypothetical protein